MSLIRKTEKPRIVHTFAILGLIFWSVGCGVRLKPDHLPDPPAWPTRILTVAVTDGVGPIASATGVLHIDTSAAILDAANDRGELRFLLGPEVPPHGASLTIAADGYRAFSTRIEPLLLDDQTFDVTLQRHGGSIT